MPRRIVAFILALMMALMACNLSVGGEPTPASTSSQAQVPTVRILEPAPAVQVVKGSKVTIRAQASSPTGVRMAELLVNDSSVPNKTQLPELAANSALPTTLDVLFEYEATQSGSLKLAVRAWSNEVQGSAAVTITVQDSLNPGPGGAGTPTVRVQPTATGSPVCRARILTNLRFRSGPGVEYPQIGLFSAGQEPPIKGYADRAQERWWQVQWGSQIGFISGDAQYSTRLGNCNTIGPVAIPPLPTPTPTLTPPPTQPGITPTPAPPDLMISQLAGVQTIELGQDGTVQATYLIRIKNIGGQMSPQFAVEVLLPNGQVQSLGVVAGLSPNQEIEFPVGGLNVTFTQAGVQRLLVSVDPQNVVAERDENNNKQSIDVTVTGGAAPTQEGQ